MKKTLACLTIALTAAFLPHPSRAQFLKNILNNAKQNITGKTAGNASQTASKTDSTGKSKPLYDSSYFAQMMAKAKKTKPSISPADSAAAIKNFMTGTGGSGMFYQYRVAYTFTMRGKDSTSVDTMSTSITDARNVRSDLGVLGGKMDVIGHADMPRYSMILYPSTKTYVFNIIDTAAINSGDQNTYRVTKAGNETVAGYPCIHSKMAITPAGGKSTVITEDVWTSTGVPGYTALKSSMAVRNVTPKMMQALDQSGCSGFIVKVGATSKTFTMYMVLITADRKTFPASQFQVPSGYTAATSQNMFGNLMRGQK
ncbi:MAG: DUF4412 domain-containing protein [Puia sp.]|nr:DUF4412 domain-containing protein [Puia sp.]